MKHSYLKKLGLLGLVVSGSFLASSEVRAQACSDLFISEYIEGGSFNKSIEIYNPTSAPISLSGYKLTLHPSAVATASAVQTLTLSGTIQPNDVYVISHASANAAILAATDLQSSAVINFNGDDAILLWKTVAGTDVIIDKLGDNNGVVPAGGAWTVGTGSTKDFTLVRKATVTGGQTDWTVSAANEWDVFAKDTDTQIGSHTATGCSTTPTGTTVGFSVAAATVLENAGAVTVTVNITNPSATAATTVDVALGTAGTATTGTDFTFTSPTTLTWAAGDNAPKTVTINVTDDAAVESAETVVLTLTNSSTGATLGTSTYTLTIDDNDAVVTIPTVTVASIEANDPITFLPSQFGQKVKLVGTLYGTNQRNAGSGLQLTLIDNTGGAGIFTSNNAIVPATVPVEGDRVRAIGTVSHFNGLTQLTLDSIVVLANNQTLITPAIVTGPLTEAHESELITLANPVSLVDPTQWKTTGASFTVQVTDGTNTYDLRIINTSNIFGTPAPTGTFVLTGIGGQFDQTDPRTDGYQIVPRRLADLRNVTGISEALSNAIAVYPNPVSGKLNLNLSAAGKNAAISVVNMLGQVVATLPASATELNVAAYPAGIYTIQIVTPSAKAVKRFVKIN